METEKIIFFRNFLFKTFLISLAFVIIYFAGTVAFWHTWVSWGMNTFKISEADFGRLTMSFFLIIRIVIVFGFLAPCIALHWMVKKRKSAS
jgi:ABC-type Na+ efflux pump permease subunit